MIENTVDMPTGTVPVRATMPNADELLWPGTLVNVEMTFREEVAVAVPSEAVQVSQAGTYVFVIKDGVASVQPVTVARIVGSQSVISDGLEGGETVVTNGQLLLTSGTAVEIREAKAGPGTPPLSPRPSSAGLTTLVLPPSSCWGLRVPSACGGGASQRRFSDAQHYRAAARRKRGDHGRLGRFADRASAVDDCRHHVAYILIFAGHYIDHDSV